MIKVKPEALYLPQMTNSSIIKRLRVHAIHQETPSAKSFILEPLDGWDLTYSSGQFITLVFNTRHGEKRRSYSLSSSPGLEKVVQITVKEVPNGEFSRWMLTHVKEGDILYSSGVGGFFVLPKKIEEKKTFCFLAAGSGITPCYSLIKTLLFTSDSRIVLIYSNASEQQTIFYKELNALAERFVERFKIKYLFSTSDNVYSKRLSRWLLDQFVPDLLGTDAPSTDYYLCGPFEYMQMAEITLRMYAESIRIHKENFSNLPRLVLPEPPDRDKHKVRIEIGPKRYTLEVQFPKSVLAAAKEKGIDLPYSCEAGRCGSCIATCSSGSMWMAYNEILTDSEVRKGRILVCQAYPVGEDATITYD